MLLSHPLFTEHLKRPKEVKLNRGEGEALIERIKASRTITLSPYCWLTNKTPVSGS
jgi:hypothetical protein